MTEELTTVEAEEVRSVPALVGSLDRPAHQMGAAVEIEVQRAVNETRAAILVARSTPRDVDHVRKSVLKACQDRALAEKAQYALDFGEKAEGPSIHLAREVARLYGNLQYGTIELHATEQYSEFETFCWDLESNNRTFTRFKVAHKRFSNNKDLKTPQTRWQNAKGVVGRELRNVIFAAVPKALVDEAVKACQQTLTADMTKNKDARIVAMLGDFTKLGITQDALEKHVGKQIDQCTPDDLVHLKKVYHAIEEGADPQTFFADDAAKNLPKPAEKKPAQTQAKKETECKPESKPEPKTEAKAQEPAPPEEKQAEPEPAAEPQAAPPPLAKPRRPF